MPLVKYHAVSPIKVVMFFSLISISIVCAQSYEMGLERNHQVPGFTPSQPDPGYASRRNNDTKTPRIEGKVYSLLPKDKTKAETSFVSTIVPSDHWDNNEVNKVSRETYAPRNDIGKRSYPCGSGNNPGWGWGWGNSGPDCCKGGGGGWQQGPKYNGGGGIPHPHPHPHPIQWKAKSQYGHGYPHRPIQPVHGQYLAPIRPPYFGNFQKPGNCYKFPFSLLNFDIFRKLKGGHETYKGGWGWNPVSQNAGYHFYKRQDTDLNRQLDISYDNQNVQDYSVNSNKYGSYPKSNGYGLGQGNSYGKHNNQDHKYEGSHTHAYEGDIYNVGIGSLSGRVFGGSGWKSANAGWTYGHNNHHCHTDFECPGSQKCCDSVCKTPSFTG